MSFNFFMYSLILIPITFIWTMAIWAIFDINKNDKLSRKEKSDLTYFVLRSPITRIFTYVFKIRKNIKN
jgi:hypothetical protein